MFHGFSGFAPKRFRFRFLLFLICTSFVFSVIASPVTASQVTLAWDATDDEVNGYRVYCGDSSGNYHIAFDVGNQTQFTLTDLIEGQVYCVAVTAYNDSGESSYSDELVFNAPPTDNDGSDIPDPPLPGDAILFSDDFERSNAVVLGNGWQEWEPSDDMVGVYDGQLMFAQTLDLTNRPMVAHAFSRMESGTVRWEFDFNWKRSGEEGTYRLFMQLGDGELMSPDFQDDGAGINLVWTRINGVHESLGYRTGGSINELAVVSGAARIAVIADLEGYTFDIEVNGSTVGTGLPFDELVALDTMRFFTDALNEWHFQGRFFDNVSIVGSTGNDTGLDSDGDGLSDFDEITVYLTDPNRADSDGDGLSDGQEVTFWGDAWNSDTDGDGLPNILDADADNDGISDGEEIQAGSDPADPQSGPPSAGPAMEVADILVDDSWQTVLFSTPFTDPVVVAGPAGLNDDDPLVIRIRNVTPLGFEIRLQEWDYQDGIHAPESVSYLAMERGGHTLENGARVEAGFFTKENAKSYGSVAFAQPFADAPVIMTSIVTFNEADAVTGRIRNIDGYGFDYRLREQESNAKKHALETVAYIAWEPSMGLVNGMNYEVNRTPDAVTHKFYPLTFQGAFTETPAFLAQMQTSGGGDSSNLRWSYKDIVGGEIQVDEEQSKDSEVRHTTEVAGYMVFGW